MSAFNLQTQFQSQEIYLDSQYATINNSNGGNSDLYFFLNSPISIPTNHDIILRIDNFVCPISFFLISSSNNKLYINTTLYSIPSGNYNATTLKSTLQSLLTGFTITYDSNSLKFTFSKSTVYTFNSYSTCFKLLGFAENNSYTASLIGGFFKLSSSTVINLSGSSLIYIDIPNITTRNVSSKNNGSFTSIIKSIVQNVPYGNILSYTNNTNSAVKIQEKYISYIHIRLLDDDYNIIDLQGQHFTLTIEFFFYNNGSPITAGENLNDAVLQQEEIKKNLLENK